MSTTTSATGLDALNNLITSTLDLITRLETVVANITAENRSSSTPNPPSSTPATNPHPEINPLSLASDSATLLRAHATKLSLLIINEPFTPSAICTILRQLTSGPLPGLASAAQICVPAQYTSTISQDLGYRISLVLKETKALVQRVPTDGKALKDNGQKNKGKSVANTGTLWAACDELVAFAKRGFGGNLVKKAEELKDTVKDVMEELKEWGEETGSDEEDEEDDEEEEDEDVREVTQSLEAAKIADTQAMLDDLMNSSSYIPRDDPDKIRERLESCLRRLRLVTLLYQATAKRRFKNLPQAAPAEGSEIPKRLDEIMVLLKKIPERFGSLALAFYELDPEEIDKLMDQCFFDCFAVAELLIKPWDGEKDEFSEWVVKFQAEVKKA
ncbi:hypothetical protein B0T20DRAFT_402552 [Sordaria brevicollis]|uniref:Cyclin-D1-binding protein 1-like N-terminal domain-containing protein n=1 Tax=Sordaria brevicollis TaxID=83679 RepID=A0AAE0UEY5_SORBR|nr:hypothetical protein B0T20DRAFT_402552 [Sordaria brevicollis]